MIVYFGLIPLLELVLPPASSNVAAEERAKLESDRFFDLVLFATVPMQIGMLVLFLFQMQDPALTNFEIIFRIIAMGLMCGVFGINVGHELGHRKPGLAHFLGEVMMLTSLELHFIPYHNRGHHTNVGTTKDPATARRNESIYVFWIRSQFGSYFQAWQIEKERLVVKGAHWLSLRNKMVVYTIAKLALCAVILHFFGWLIFLYFLAAATIGILLLETINYIEHYGLMRQKNERGRYERVQHHHSWNSDHMFGRMVLFELSRHSDHHYKASRKYQVLESLPGSPQLPTGYPGTMLFTLIPPLWFRYMNRRIDGLSG